MYTAKINYIIYVLLLRAIFIYLFFFKREIYFEREICHAENMEYILTEENKKRIEKSGVNDLTCWYVAHFVESIRLRRCSLSLAHESTTRE